MLSHQPSTSFQVPSIEIQGTETPPGSPALTTSFSTETNHASSSSPSNTDNTTTTLSPKTSVTAAAASPKTRPRTFSLSHLVTKTRRAYSVSSAYPPKILPSLALPPKSQDITWDQYLAATGELDKKPPPSFNLSPAQRRNSVAATARRYEDFEQKIEEAPLAVLVSTYLNYLVLILFGHLRDILGKCFKRKEYAHLRMNEVSKKRTKTRG